LAIDDFGTGYSSLGYLQNYPFNTLKIDRCFISDLVDNEDSASLVRAIIAMAQSLRLSVVAEGVETEEQRSFLEQAGCNILQGWLFGKAMPNKSFAALAGELES
jgi:EAL domain-containing protein (putative c-di-GMP-specific phosphodiesterase class I)